MWKVEDKNNSKNHGEQMLYYSKKNENRMSGKAIFFGALSMIVASFIIGLLIGVPLGINNIGIDWFFGRHPSIIYIINIISGFIGGFVTFKLSKGRLFANLLTVSSIVFLLSLLINYIQAQSSGVSLKSAVFPLIIGCISPFVLLFFTKSEQNSDKKLKRRV